MISEKEFFYSNDDVVSDIKGFNVAFALTKFDDNFDGIEDEEIGTLKAFYREWGFENSVGATVSYLDVRDCTYADFHLDEDGNPLSDEPKIFLTENEKDPDGTPVFFPPNEFQVNFVKQYGKKMKCLDNEKIKLQGDYDSTKARQFCIAFEACDPDERAKTGKTCKSEDEIKNWMKGKFVVNIENTWTFRQEEYGRKKLTAESQFNWFMLNSSQRSEKSREFTVSGITFQDEFIQLGDWTATPAEFFRIEPKVDRPYEYPDKIMFMLRYEMNKNQFYLERTIYGVLDWLGDIGGFNEAIAMIIGATLFFIQFQPLGMYLVGKLYKFGPTDTPEMFTSQVVKGKNPDGGND